MLLTSMLRIFLTYSFKPFVLKGNFNKNLDFKGINNLGLYVHIPFCKSLCSFCPYCKELYSKEKATTYKRALLKEIDLSGKNLDGKKEVASLYIGGGTPAIMINDLGEIIARVKKYFSIKGGIGIELHPDDITTANLQKLVSAGVTMVSIGIQSFDLDCLDKLGRNSNASIEKLGLVKSYGFQTIDVDLIFAIPGQTGASLVNDVKTAFEAGATQVSTYPFIDFSYSSNIYKPIPDKTKKKMLKMLADYCDNHKIDRSSVWTFNKQEAAIYSSITRDSYLGFGVSAASLLNSRFTINTHSVSGYIERLNKGLLPTSLTLDFTKKQKAAYYLFWNSYNLRINKNRFTEMFGIPLNSMFGIQLYIAKKLGYIREYADTYDLTARGTALFHSIEQAYTRSYIDKMWNISRLEPFPERIVLR